MTQLLNKDGTPRKKIFRMVRLNPKEEKNIKNYVFDTYLDTVRIYNDLPITHKFKSFKKNGHTKNNATPTN